jgi:hypothetical protein
VRPGAQDGGGDDRADAAAFEELGMPGAEDGQDLLLAAVSFG